jgi:leucyl aminopeptidase
MFLLQFIKDGTKWAHLDIASVANNVGFVPYNPKRGSTGYGVRLLVETTKRLAV